MPEKVEAKIQHTTLGLRDEIAARLFVARVARLHSTPEQITDNNPATVIAHEAIDVTRDDAGNLEDIARGSLEAATIFCRARYQYDLDPANRSVSSL